MIPIQKTLNSYAKDSAEQMFDSLSTHGGTRDPRDPTKSRTEYAEECATLALADLLLSNDRIAIATPTGTHKLAERDNACMPISKKNICQPLCPRMHISYPQNRPHHSESRTNSERK